MPVTAKQLSTRLRARARPEDAAIRKRFFKTGKDEYGERDVFIGVRLSELRILCRNCRGVSLREITSLLRSRVHEERLLALLLLVDAFRRGGVAEQRHIYDLYLAQTAFINNWDLVGEEAHDMKAAVYKQNAANQSHCAAFIQDHYFDPSHFLKAFNQYTGVTPRAYSATSDYGFIYIPD